MLQKQDTLVILAITYVTRPTASDQSVFGPFKAAYKKELGLYAEWDASIVIGKRNSIICYNKARKAALTSKNIISGCKWTGLWPVNMARSLISLLLPENTSTPAKQAYQICKGRSNGKQAKNGRQIHQQSFGQLPQKGTNFTINSAYSANLITIRIPSACFFGRFKRALTSKHIN
jgi:hypothetical protein